MNNVDTIVKNIEKKLNSMSIIEQTEYLESLGFCFKKNTSIYNNRTTTKRSTNKRRVHKR